MAVIDNDLYNRLSETWWDENEPLSLLRTVINPARIGYFQRILIDELQRDPVGMTALDVGCGGGILAEEFARLGCAVTGVDPSTPSLDAARAHALKERVAITYLEGAGENLPFHDASFDIVYCCDVLEHVSDLDRVIAEGARVLKPGGIYFYDTINRTPISKLVYIKLFQEWSATSFMPPNLHVWSKFIKPKELRTVMTRHELQEGGLTGFKPALSPPALVSLLRRRKRGAITMSQFAARAVHRESRDTATSYMGYAMKAG
jgi:2-polyprenyl-6-hydroxyphenyl methylase / 3-demethylubiquinone-9 3-methyltransferase